jgi:hypothetical protein
LSVTLLHNSHAPIGACNPVRGKESKGMQNASDFNLFL